jgi:hypothetical protein
VTSERNHHDRPRPLPVASHLLRSGHMQLGAHLPLIDFNGRGYDNRLLGSFTDAAREIGFTALASNDHITFQRPLA